MNIKWGLITGGVYVILQLIGNLLGVGQGTASPMTGFAINVLTFGATFYTIHLGIKEARDTELGGYLVMGQAIRKGMKIALVASVIAAIFGIIYMTVIDPDMAETIKAASEAQMDKNNVPEEQREMARKISGIFTNPIVMIPFMIVWIAFWGLIKSLISGAILKREPPVA